MEFDDPQRGEDALPLILAPADCGGRDLSRFFPESGFFWKIMDNPADGFSLNFLTAPDIIL